MALHRSVAGCQNDIFITVEAFETVYGETIRFTSTKFCWNHISSSYGAILISGDQPETDKHFLGTDCLKSSCNERLCKHLKFVLHLFRRLCMHNNARHNCTACTCRASILILQFSSATSQSTQLEQREEMFNSHCLMSKCHELLHKCFRFLPHISSMQQQCVLEKQRSGNLKARREPISICCTSIFNP